MEHLKLWIHDHINLILLTSGTAAGSAGFNLIAVHEWLAVILQIAGLISFSMVFLMNYEKAWGKFKDLVLKILKWLHLIK